MWLSSTGIRHCDLVSIVFKHNATRMVGYVDCMAPLFLAMCMCLEGKGALFLLFSPLTGSVSEWPTVFNQKVVK